MTRDLTEVLYSIVPQATFDCREFGLFSPEALQSVYQDAKEMRGIVASAKLNVPEDLLAELTDVMRTLLREYIVDDRFGSSLDHVAGESSSITVEGFAESSVISAAVLGPEKISEWVCDWVNGKPVPYQLHAVLLGLTAVQPLEMEGGVRFRTISDFPDVGDDLLIDSIYPIAPSTLIGALKVDITCEVGVSVCKPGNIQHSPVRTWEYGSVSRNTVDELCEALSLACNCYVSPVVQWPDFDDEVKILGLALGTTYSFREEDAFFWPSVMMEDDHLEDVRELLEKRTSASYDRSGLGLALSRWMRSKRQKGYVDKFIELRIALEALYLQGKGTRGEMGFRLANYGAWHLGADFAERRKYRTLLSRVYREASGAVHTAEVADTEANRELLSEAQDLCRMGILKRLDEGKAPDWDELILGGGP